MLSYHKNRHISTLMAVMQITVFIIKIAVTVHSVRSNLVKMHSKSPSMMAFCPVCLGILPVNSYGFLPDAIQKGQGKIRS